MSKSRASKQRGYSALIGRKKPEKCIYESKRAQTSKPTCPKINDSRKIIIKI